MMGKKLFPFLIILLVLGCSGHAVRDYYPSGALKAEVAFLDHDLDGQTRIYYETGELKETIGFKNGRLHGTTRIYDKCGCVKEEWTFDNGQLVGNVRLIDEFGTVHYVDAFRYDNGVNSVLFDDKGNLLNVVRSSYTDTTHVFIRQ